MEIRGLDSEVSLDKALVAYSETESIKKLSVDSEQKRIRMLRRELMHIDWPVNKITDLELIDFKNKLKAKGREDATVLRYFNVISSFFEWCRIEKKWIEVNPVRQVRLPKKPEPRFRRISEMEVRMILDAAGLEIGQIPKNKTQETALAWLIAIATGKRASEIIDRRRQEINVKVRSVFVARSKNGSSRLVPLDKIGAYLWWIALQMHPDGKPGDRVFSVSNESRSSLWYKLRANAGLGHVDLKFHDSRHEAASQLSKRMSALPLAKIFGWKNLKYAMVYYNPTHEELLEQIDSSDECHATFSRLGIEIMPAAGA